MEALRVLACLAVIFNHSPRSSYFLFATREPGSFLYFAELAVSISCKFAVPAFFAISGALMLDKEISMKKLWLKRIPRTAVMLAVFSLISHLIGVAAGEPMLGIKGFIFRAYDADLNYSYWYLYSYLAFLVVSPLLSAMLRNLKNREIIYMLGVALAFRSLIPALERLHWEGDHQLNTYLSNVWLTVDIVFYPTIGYFLHNRMDIRACRRALPFLWLAAAAGMYASCRLTWQEFHQRWITHIETYHGLFAGVYAAAIFASMRALYENVPQDGRLGRWTMALGGLTLGVYLLHVPIMDHTRLFQELVWIPMDLLHLPQLLCGAIYIVLLFLFCAAITAVLKRIPGIKTLLS